MDFIKTKGGNGETLGLGMLGTISAFSIWSAVNPSFFTIREFSTGKKSSVDNVKWGMRLGLVLDLVLGAGLALAYGKKGFWPGVLTALTGVGLYGAYEYTLKNAHTNNPDGKTMESYHASSNGAYQAGIPPGMIDWAEHDPEAISEDVGPWHISKGGGLGGGLSISGPGGISYSHGGGPGGGESYSGPGGSWSHGGGWGGGWSGEPGWSGGGWPGYGGGGWPYGGWEGGFGGGGWPHHHRRHHHRRHHHYGWGEGFPPF